jgi:predicted amidohydrolase YtcJ
MDVAVPVDAHHAAAVGKAADRPRRPRHNVIEALAPLEDGGVVFAGATDGPITHTDPAELSSTALLGVLRP